MSECCRIGDDFAAVFLRIPCTPVSCDHGVEVVDRRVFRPWRAHDKCRYNPPTHEDQTMTMQHQLEVYVKENRKRYEDLLGQMVNIPSISMDPAKANDMRRMATLARQVLSDLGTEARIVETGGYPFVSAGWMTGARYPTVTVYNHMDVQPAQEPEWQRDPFAFQNEGGLYRGRGATDDKGTALSALFGARFAIDQGMPINMRFLGELEEETGSPHFAAGLKQRAEVPRPDSVVVSDTIWIAKGRPAMPYGLRGLIGARLTLRT